MKTPMIFFQFKHSFEQHSILLLKHRNLSYSYILLKLAIPSFSLFSESSHWQTAGANGGTRCELSAIHSVIILVISYPNLPAGPIFHTLFRLLPQSNERLFQLLKITDSKKRMLRHKPHPQVFLSKAKQIKHFQRPFRDSDD